METLLRSCEQMHTATLCTNVSNICLLWNLQFDLKLVAGRF